MSLLSVPLVVVVVVGGIVSGGCSVRLAYKYRLSLAFWLSLLVAAL